MVKKFLPCLFLLSACQNGAMAPWNYAPPAQSKSWDPSAKEMRKLSAVMLDTSFEIPRGNHPVALAELFDIGLRNSPVLAEVWQQAREAAAVYGESLASYYPNLTFQGYLLSQRIGFVLNGMFDSSTSTAYGPLVLFNYTIWDSGERDAQSETSLQALNYANWTHGQAIQTLLKDIAAAFYDHLYAKALLEALQDDLNDAQQNYRAAEENFRLGIKDITDVLQTKTNALQKEIAVTQQIARVENSYIDLLKVVGIPTGAEFPLPPFPDTAPVRTTELSVDNLVEIAKRYRPDYLAAKADVLSKEANVQAQRAQVYPELAISGNGGQTWYTDGASDNGTYTVLLNLTFPIFSGFLYQNQVRGADALLRSSTSTLRQTELSITADVRTTYNSFDAAKKQVVMTEDYLAAASQEYHAIFSRYRQGTTDILDVFSSQASLSDARAKTVQAKRNLFVSMVNLTFATGMLCKNS